MSIKGDTLVCTIGKNKIRLLYTKVETAFQLVKQALHSDAVLVYFDSLKHVILSCDALLLVLVLFYFIYLTIN